MDRKPMMWKRFVSISSQLAELGVFAAAAGVLAVGMMALR
jgi:hypothetical protein